VNVPVHIQIKAEACALAEARLAKAGRPTIGNPTEFLPLLARGTWMNDYNQATVFTDVLENRTPQVHPEIRRLFQSLWQIERRRIVEQMAIVDRNRADAADRLSRSAVDADEFGSYEPRDHLDVLKDVPTNEYGPKPASFHVSQTVESSLAHVGDRLRPVVAYDAKWRRDVSQVTALGRALHTVADFFAHSNYVELLLWQLAKDNPGAHWVPAFNAPKDGPFEKRRVDYVCPLPVNGCSAPRTNGILWYGASPADTPLVSTVFDGRDTAFTLVRMYAAQLESVEASELNGQELNLLFAVLDLPGEAIVRVAWSFYTAIRDVLEVISARVRGWLAGYLLERAAAGGPEACVLEAASSIVRGYDSKEAAQWARAGKFRYVASVVEKDISRLLDEQDATKPALPHHSLLCKDSPPQLPDDWARYSLACLLATDVSASILETYFDAQPDPARWDAIRLSWLRHPAEELARPKPPFDRKQLGALVDASFLAHWRTLLSRGPIYRDVP
jgi:Heterokaryon incompatibility protein Het-C